MALLVVNGRKTWEGLGETNLGPLASANMLLQTLKEARVRVKSHDLQETSPSGKTGEHDGLAPDRDSMAAGIPDIPVETLQKQTTLYISPICLSMAGRTEA